MGETLQELPFDWSLGTLGEDVELLKKYANGMLLCVGMYDECMKGFEGTDNEELAKKINTAGGLMESAREFANSILETVDGVRDICLTEQFGGACDLSELQQVCDNMRTTGRDIAQYLTDNGIEPQSEKIRAFCTAVGVYRPTSTENK